MGKKRGRACGPCQNKVRNELDRRLLEMEITHETYRTISNDFGHSEASLKRHKANHLTLDLAAVKAAKDAARAEHLEEVHAEELEAIKTTVSNGMAARLDNAESYLDKLNVALYEAADLLDRAKGADDLRAAGVFLGRLTDQIKLSAELAGKLQTQPQINILVNPEWIELQTLIVTTLKPYPEALEAVRNALPST